MSRYLDITSFIDHNELETILQSGIIDINLQDQNGMTILMKLPELHVMLDLIPNIIEITTLLIRYGAYLDMQDDKGNTALFYGCQYGHLNYCSQLLYNGADLKIKNNDGITALDEAIQHNNFADIDDLELFAMFENMSLGH